MAAEICCECVRSGGETESTACKKRQRFEVGMCTVGGYRFRIECIVLCFTVYTLIHQYPVRIIMGQCRLLCSIVTNNFFELFQTHFSNCSKPIFRMIIQRCISHKVVVHIHKDQHSHRVPLFSAHIMLYVLLRVAEPLERGERRMLD